MFSQAKKSQGAAPSSVTVVAGTARAVAIASLLCFSAGAMAQPAEWAPGRIIVQTRAGLSDTELGKILKTHSGKSRRVGKSDLFIVDLPAGKSETAVQKLLEHHPHLKFAELDRKVNSTLAVTDPYLGSQWHLAKINASAAWDRSQGLGITIAILDSGVLPNHPDLIQVPGWNFVDNNSNTADVNGHGTSVAGAAAAVTNNALGVAGVAGAARVMPIRVSDASGFAYYSTIASGVTYAADNGARVANASFSGVYASSAIQSAGQYLKNKGGLLVVAAGNAGTNDGAPAVTSMIPVSATDSNDAKASWSSFGSYVALAAPGVGIWTTSNDGSYRSASGTSFASPITAGVVALVMATKPTLSSSQVESLLYSTALDLGTAGRDIYFGYGRVDAAAAVNAAANTVAADTQAPSVAIAAPLGSSTVGGLTAVDVTASDNVGVTKVELRVNGNTVATDLVAPFQFSWDSSSAANGSASLVAVAYDAAGNSKASSPVVVNVANNLVADTVPPTVDILFPKSGSKATKVVSVSVSAADNAGPAGLTQQLYLNGSLVASAVGSTLSYSWNTGKAPAGTNVLTAVARDAAGNTSTTSVSVIK